MTTAVRWRESFGCVAAAETEEEAEKALPELTSQQQQQQQQQQRIAHVCAVRTFGGLLTNWLKQITETNEPIGYSAFLY